MLYELSKKTQFRGYMSITEDVEKVVAKSGVMNGYMIVSVPHTTASLAITSFWDKRGLDDLMDEIDRNFPSRVSYKHQDSPFDASGHVKSATIGTSKMLAIQNGKMVLGSSQGLVLLEFDGPRERKVNIELVETGSAMNIEKKNLVTTYMGMHDLTDEIRGVIAKSGIKNGICHISMLHSTAGLLICSKDEASRRDIMGDIERMVPTRVDFKHRETASDAGGHVKTAITNSQVSLIIDDGKLVIGKEQAIVFAEFDGPRPRSYYVCIYSEAREEKVNPYAR